MRSLFAALLLFAGGAQALPFISEIHYDNSGSDVGEFVELTGIDLDLSGWSLHFYNGATGGAYDVLALSGIFPAAQLGALAFFPAFSLQNGPADGVALIDAGGSVVEFIAYEGALIALSGPAAGHAARQLPIAESNATPIGDALQRTHLRNTDLWAAAQATPGRLNYGLVPTPASALLLLWGLALFRLRTASA